MRPFDPNDGRVRGGRGVRLRAEFLRLNPLCKHCDEKGITRLAEQVDHVIPLEQGGEDKDNNKQALCVPCHAAKTATEQSQSSRAQVFPEWLLPAACPLVIVFGAPGSGKSTYVAQHAAHDDLVIDLDLIRARMSNRPIYQSDDSDFDAAMRARNAMLGTLHRTHTPTWFIASGVGNKERAWWVDKLKPVRAEVLKPSLDECIRRIKADTRRPARIAERHIKAARDWYISEGRGWRLASPGGFDDQGNPLSARHHGHGGA